MMLKVPNLHQYQVGERALVVNRRGSQQSVIIQRAEKGFDRASNGLEACFDGLPVDIKGRRLIEIRNWSLPEVRRRECL
jgi:hypothetical protein